jgi:hypothetical protein
MWAQAATVAAAAVESCNILYYVAATGIGSSWGAQQLGLRGLGKSTAVPRFVALAFALGKVQQN